MNNRFWAGMIVGAMVALGAGLTAPRREKRDLTDPETLLQMAQQEMREAQAKNRERAVSAITQKNLLQAECDKLQKMLANLEAKEAQFRQRGDDDDAEIFAVQRQAMEKTLKSVLASLQEATELTEMVKANIRREEERIRTKTVQAMALKTQWKQVQIERSINKTYLQQAAADVEHHFEAARRKLEKAKAENALLAQIRASVDALQVESERARERGDAESARRLLAQRDALAKAAAVR